MRLTGWVDSVVDFVEAQGGDETAQVRARALAILLAGAAGISLVMAVVYGAMGLRSWLAPFLALLACLAVAWVWRMTCRLEAAASVAAAVQLVEHPLAALTLGQPVLLSWAALVPLTAILFGGHRAGRRWLMPTVAVTLASGALFASGVVRVVNPGPVVPVLSAAFLVVVLGLAALMFEELRARVEASLDGARQAAEQASREKDRFLASVSHEIRTPLNGVLGMTELLLLTETKLPAKVKDDLETIHSSGKMLRVLIDDLLDLSRAREGRLSLSVSPFRPAPIVDEVLSLYTASATGKGLTLTAEGTLDASLRLEGDRVRLFQILANLVSNAVKFTRTGSVTIRASAEEDGAAHHLVIAVADTGPGIRPEDQGRLFTPFSQLDTARGKGGTGLGLAVSAQLASLMGGTITVDSEVGQGSTFTLDLYLPTVEGEHTLTRSLAPRRTVAGRVLVVDDNPINLKVASGLLERTGASVLTATDGAAALELLAGEQVDLVLMDIQMPVMDGLTATRALRDREASGTVRTPVVALTASVLESEVEACLAAGMDDCLAKPVNARALDVVLGRYLGAARRPAVELRGLA